MSTSTLLRASLLLSLFLSSCSSPEPESDPVPPKHVVLIVVDTLRADHLSSYGYELPTSPHLDQLTEDGVRFERAFSQSSWTAPSMVSLMTGCYLGEERLSLPQELPVIAELFKDAGYATGAFIHNPIINSDNGFQRGFDEFNCPKVSKHNNPTKGYPAVEPAAAWIAEHASESTFTYVHYSDPHSPYGPQSEERQHWMKDPPVLSDELEDHLRAYEASPPEKLGHLEHSIEQIRVSIAGYNDDVVQSDLRISQIMDCLKEHNLYEDSVIIVTSDHGEMLGDHGLMSKLGFFDQSFHIPLIIRYPALDGPAGGVVDRFTENVDLMPTLLDLAGAEVPRQCQGRSLRPFLAGEEPDQWRSAVHWEYDFRLFAGVADLPGNQCNLAVHRDRTGKYVHFAGWPALFYDLVDDPGERRPLAAHPSMADHAAALLGWRMATDEQELSDHLALPGGMVILDA